jgi:hypothetical protein
MSNFGEYAIFLGQLSDFSTEALVPSLHTVRVHPVSDLLSVANQIAMRMSGLFRNNRHYLGHEIANNYIADLYIL